MRARRTGPARHRKDGNYDALTEIAQKAGFLVFGCNNELCDAIWQLHGVTLLIEVKMPGGELTEDQEKRRAKGWVIRTVRTAADVLEARAQACAGTVSGAQSR